jgi:hypothetical protein
MYHITDKMYFVKGKTEKTKRCGQRRKIGLDSRIEIWHHT